MLFCHRERTENKKETAGLLCHFLSSFHTGGACFKGDDLGFNIQFLIATKGLIQLATFGTVGVNEQADGGEANAYKTQ